MLFLFHCFYVCSSFLGVSPYSLCISAFPHHFLPLFYTICLFGFPPLSFSFDFLYFRRSSLCSIIIISHSCAALVYTTCKGNLPLHEVYTWSSSIVASEENEIAGLSLQWILKKSPKGGYRWRPHNAHQFSFPRQFRVYGKTVRAAVPALQGIARLLRTKWLKNMAGSIHKAGSQRCAVNWPLNMLHESGLYHCIEIL